MKCLLVIFCVLHFIVNASAQRCEDYSEGAGYTHPRVFAMIQQGGDGKFYVAKRENALNSLGGCRTPEKHATKVQNYFEETYGADMSPVRERPYQVYENDQYTYTPMYENPVAKNQVVISTFYEYVRYTPIPLTFSSFSLLAKREIIGPKGTIPAGSQAYYGLVRWVEDGREHCVDYWERTPFQYITDPNNPPSFDGTLHLMAEHNFWGKGSIPGYVRVFNGTTYASWVLTLPDV